MRRSLLLWLYAMLSGATVYAFADNPCLSCHSAQVKRYSQSAMARSLSRVAGPQQGNFIHRLSETKVAIKPAGKTVQITMSRAGASGSMPVEYVIGSGNHAYGYLVRTGNYLFEAPVSYYAGRASWDMAPGFETDPDPDFTRPVTAECLQCHSGRPRPVVSTLNRFEDPPFADEAISCDRCHGDPAGHLKAPGRNNILNPARLPLRARDSICEQCHLSGEIRILNPGRQWGDFQAGQNLEEVFSVYLRDQTHGTNSAIKVVSHAEQLALSRCARSSEGKLWCGTCHDPHAPRRPTATDYRERCLNCHGQELLKTHSKPTDNCVGCHMQKQPARDGGHTAFTDHRISRTPPAQPKREVPVEKLIAWHQPSGPLALRNLGLANIEIGERQHSAALVEEGARQVVEAMKSLPPEPVMLSRVGMVLLRKGETADATEVLEFALQLDPARAGSHVNLGNAYAQAGLVDKAVAEFDKAIELDPSLQSAYQSLADLYMRSDKPDAARSVLQRYLKFMPQSLAAQNAVSASGGP